MYDRILIKANERAIVIKNGRAERWLEPGQHTLWRFGANVEVVRYDLDTVFTNLTPELECVLPEGAGERLVVGANALAAVSVDGRPHVVLQPGRYVLWQQRAVVTAEVYEADDLFTDLPRPFWALTPSHWLTAIGVQPWQRCLLYVDGALHTALEAGFYGLNIRDRDVRFDTIDMREQELQIVGQEVMTADKVTIRINLVVTYRVVDAATSAQAVASVRDAVYSEAQLIARRHVGQLGIDALLEQRGAGGQPMLEALAARCGGWGVEPLQLDLKDIMLPGEMKTILNRVIEAEKQAAANIILRREETAATRSMANTAKMLQANPTLLRLKELDAIKEIADRIDKITVVTGGGDMMGRLMIPSEG